MRNKKYRHIKEQAPTEAVALPVAVAFIKEHARPSFDETVELHVHLGVDPEKSDQTVRGTVQLPAGPPKQQRVVVFTSDQSQQQEVKAAGAAEAGGEELVESIIQIGGLEADITIATPQMMPTVARAAKILGPRGLMPNPKTGTVSDQPSQTLQQLLGGKVAFKMDQQANIHLAIGKASWAPDKIIANVNTCLQAVREARPAAVKGEFIRSVSLKTTMSPAVRLAR
ncbi:MAG: 50S ribosomal protein L1 [Candidatus Andersenbacteria bacterium]|nr:50S ribosomal protein L1 [Candidatus Andersenbacteria bacterium]